MARRRRRKRRVVKRRRKTRKRGLKRFTPKQRGGKYYRMRGRGFGDFWKAVTRPFSHMGHYGL